MKCLATLSSIFSLLLLLFCFVLFFCFVSFRFLLMRQIKLGCHYYQLPVCPAHIIYSLSLWEAFALWLASLIKFERSGFEPWSWSFCCVLGQDTLLSQSLSSQEWDTYGWLQANCQGNLKKCWGATCDGLASHPGGVAIFLVASCYRNRDKLLW